VPLDIFIPPFDLAVLPPILNVAGPTDTVARDDDVLSKLADPDASLPIGRDGSALGPDGADAFGLLAISLLLAPPNVAGFFPDRVFLLLSSSFFIAMISILLVC
jgi:hypothetical protein